MKASTIGVRKFVTPSTMLFQISVTNCDTAFHAFVQFVVSAVM